jgi:hypothetical protein
VVAVIDYFFGKTEGIEVVVFVAVALVVKADYILFS